MKALTFTKKQITRAAAIAAGVVAAAAVAIVVVLTSVGTRAAERLLPIYCVERGDKKIALTFDVAWENSNTQKLIDILKENDAKATFFVTGDWCDRYPEDVKMFFDAGHDIQNHSNAHPHVEGMNINELINDTRECNRKIKMITGVEPTLYRAPYGEFDDSLITTMDGMGMKVIQWDVDSVDWKKPSAAQIQKKVLKGVKSGSILLFHNDLENTTEALPEILKKLKSEGYEFVPVKDMIYTENYTIDAQGKQVPAVKSSIELTEEKIEQVLAQYSDKIKAAGITDEQIQAAKSAIKNGDLSALPTELQPFAEQVMAQIGKDGVPLDNNSDISDLNSSSTTSGDTSVSIPQK